MSFLRRTLSCLGLSLIPPMLFALVLIGIWYFSDRSKLSAACEVGADERGNTCTFTNTGSGPGSVCVMVEMANQQGETLRSRPVCSGRLGARSSAEHRVVFVDGDVADLCGASVKSNCSMEIHQFEERPE
jgi:hypothetical protein